MLKSNGGKNKYDLKLKKKEKEFPPEQHQSQETGNSPS